MSRNVRLSMVTIFNTMRSLAERRAENLEMIDKAGREGSDIVLLPELCDHHRTTEAVDAYYNGGKAAILEKIAFTMDSPWVREVSGLAGKYKAKPRQLSGGEQQRVALARALVNRPTILLADEPTGNLDPKNSWEIMKLMEQINENGTTVIVVTHNREIVNAMQKRVVTMKRGVIFNDEEKGGYLDED